VAELAGVSIATVSRALNGSPRVLPATQALVEEAVAQLGYVPNPAARSLVTGRTSTIALVVSEPESRLFSDPFFASVVHGISSAIADGDLQLVLLLAHTEREHVKVERYVRQGHVDGVILVSLHGDDPLPRRLVQAGVPTVLSGRPPDAAQPIAYVDADNRGGGRAAATRLLERGARAIATVTASATRCPRPGAPRTRASSRTPTSASRAASARCASCSTGRPSSTPSSSLRIRWPSVR
jgi:DNA-binding LacI/PurR family transcriptional regulator